MQVVRRLWTEENVTYDGEHFSVTDSTVATPHPAARRAPAPAPLLRRRLRGRRSGWRATEADVQLFWGETLDGVRERIEHLRS